jgi:anaerobic selenocysteine-containing dehydrogenase
MAPWPGSEAAILLAVASHRLSTGQVDRAFIERWVKRSTYMEHRHPDRPG